MQKIYSCHFAGEFLPKVIAAENSPSDVAGELSSVVTACSLCLLLLTSPEKQMFFAGVK